MQDNIVLTQISTKIKSVRKSKNLTIQEIADRAGVSKGLISQIENSRTIPSLLVLIQIIKALDIDLNTFFYDLGPNGLPNGIVVRRKGEYEAFEKEKADGYLYQRIFTKKFTNTTVDIVLLEIIPGASRKPVKTDAFEYKYMIQGEIEYQFKDQTMVLEEGDSLLFDGRIEHNPVNIGKDKAIMLVVYFFEEK